MDILNLTPDKGESKKPEIERVEREKDEYILIGKYLRKKGLRLYAYNYMKEELYECDIRKKEAVNLIPEEGKLIPVNLGLEEVTVDTRYIHFEALNQKNAEKRIRRWKEGKVKDLCNLREYKPEDIKLF